MSPHVPKDARAAPLRLQGKVPTKFTPGECTGCSTPSTVGMAETNWGIITLCRKCLAKAIKGNKGPKPMIKEAGKWASTDVLDRRVAGSPGTGKRR